MTKAEILEQYLNRAPFGSNLVGLQAASRRYFAKLKERLGIHFTDKHTDRPD